LAPALSHKRLIGKGHALLTEAPSEVAEAISSFLRIDLVEENSRKGVINMGGKVSAILANSTKNSSNLDGSEIATDAPMYLHPDKVERIGSLDYEAFAIDLVDDQRKTKGVAGIGWSVRSKTSERVKKRRGFLIQLSSADGTKVGIGEVSPLAGLHPESFEDAEFQLIAMANSIVDDKDVDMPVFDPGQLLAMEGALSEFLDSFSTALGIETLLLSIRSGLEMALIALSSQIVRLPIHEALIEYSSIEHKTVSLSSFLSINGLVTRGFSSQASQNEKEYTYDSWKIKVGNQSPVDDALAIASALQLSRSNVNGQKTKVRADANRSFNETSALEILSSVTEFGLDRFEYVEEPLRVSSGGATWNLSDHIGRLQKLYEETRVPFALDESIFDLAELHNFDFLSILRDLKRVLPTSSGCVALVLKPSLLGLELSLRLARAARSELNIGAVFTSSFDTGVGLSYATFLASLSDQSGSRESVRLFSHGLGTFKFLSTDCLSPSFASYVNTKGKVNVASLSRALFGLTLDEMESLSSSSLPILQTHLTYEEGGTVTSLIDEFQSSERSVCDEFEASTTISRDGREITVVASLPLPFSAEIAHARFTDLPQQPRWSPWISSVAYLDDGETEWTLRVRGKHFRWRATSTLLEEPYKGIQWESISGLKNTGFVEFMAEDNACLMKVTIAFVAPRILSSLFRGTSMFFEDFLRNKILKWSLEMFRDVVKGDLALEEGNIELGDALFTSVAGKASVIEATLSTSIDD